MATKLTERQRAVLGFIKEHVSSQGYPPTIREICGHFGFSSPLSAKQHVDALHRKGYIKKSSLKQRGIQVAHIRPPGAISVPLAGRIRAGGPMLAAEDIEEYIAVDRNIFPAEKGFALRVVGDSMVGAGILDGDIVFIDPEKEIKNGHIVVALIDDEATLKRFYKRGRRIHLVPENRDMGPIVVKPSEVRLIGRVTGMMRRF